MTVLVVLVVVLAAALTASGWLLRAAGPWRGAAAAGLAGCLLTLGLVAVLHGPVAGPGGVSDTLLVGLFAVAVAGGGPVTAAVLRLADAGDGGDRGRHRGAHAEQVLRGGAWIGTFERAAVFGALVAGWPEGLAVVLALKGLGRYSELRADAGSPGAPPSADAGGVAERFIIGTFASVLWAVACAGALAGLTR
jgi:hypothetical protein